MYNSATSVLVALFSATAALVSATPIDVQLDTRGSTPKISPALTQPPPASSLFNGNSTIHYPADNEKRQTVYSCTQNEITLNSINDPTPGPGDPHQNYLHQQISDTITCNQATCSVSTEQGQSVSIGFSFSSGDALTDWISGGFEVSTSWEWSQTETCQGAPGQSVCLWYTTAHTAYTVGSQYSSGDYSNCLNPGAIDGVGILKSPNNNNVGGGYYCVVGDCRNVGDSYWEGGCAGGSQGYCGDGSVL